MSVTDTIPIIAATLIILMALGLAEGAVEIRGQVATGNFEWNSQNFAGFYYDIDQNIGTENLTFRFNSIDPAHKTLSDKQDSNGNRGAVYLSKAQPTNFKFEPWGQYYAISFLGEKYFAAYSGTPTGTMVADNLTEPYLYNKSANRNLMINGQISKILIDDDKERTIAASSPLELAEDYQLAIKRKNPVHLSRLKPASNDFLLTLSKNGRIVDSKLVMEDSTYYYKTNIGNTTDIVQIAVHFNSSLPGFNASSITIDGVFQISDTATSLNVDQQYDKMSIRDIDPGSLIIKMDNKYNQINLSKDKDILLMQDIYIKTADQDAIDAVNPLRFYVHRVYTVPPGEYYEIRSAVHNLSEAEAIWDNSSFPGFYYDLDENIGKETLTFRPTGAVLRKKRSAIIWMQMAKGVWYTIPLLSQST